MWRVSLDSDGPVAASRLDDGGDAFCFDPDVSDDSNQVAWVGWSPPSMPWDSAHVVVARQDPPANPVERRGREAATMQQPRWCVDGSLACVHDASGWLNVYVGGDAVAAEPFEHAGPTWGMGQRSYATSPDGALVAFTRNEHGFGRLCVADRTTGEVRDVARGVHGQLTWVGDTLVALRTGARTPTQVVAYADRRLGTHRARGRPEQRLGPRRAAGARTRRRSTSPASMVTRVTDPISSSTPADTPPATAGCCAGSTAARPISGRSTSGRASPTGGVVVGTCWWSTREGAPATGVATSRRSTGDGAATTSTTPPH